MSLETYFLNGLLYLMIIILAWSGNLKDKEIEALKKHIEKLEGQA